MSDARATKTSGRATASSADPRIATIDNCAREPIHVPGSIQPHGFLLALREPDLTITYASANAEQFLGTARAVVGRELRQLLDERTFEGILRGMAETNLGPQPRRAGAITADSGDAYNVLAHRHSGPLILEFEPAGPIEGGVELLHDQLVAEVARLEQATSVEELCGAAVAGVHRLTGFEKVMAYGFDADWNGTVLAEVGPDDMDAYLGLRFPASDIPAQARELYRRNPIRLIADVGYQPAPLVVAEQGQGPLDLSHSVLRSVSPIHIEYLKNMAVGASMSVSILHGGQLWGLIACHHRTPRFIPHAVRSACTILSRLAGQLVTTIETQREAVYASDVRAVQARLLHQVADSDNLANALAACETDLLRLADADGAAVLMDGELRLLGTTPTAKEVAELSEWLLAADAPVFHSNWLTAQYPQARSFESRAGGVLAITLSSVYQRCVLWFRQEQVQTVNWAGDPTKAVEPDSLALHPRKSFQVWKEQVGCKSRPWRAVEVEAATSLRDVLVDGLLRKAEEEAAKAKDQFLAVLSHELRTPLSPVLTAASALEHDPSLSSDTRELMRVIRRNVELETRLIDDLLDLTRISRGKLVLDLETVDVHALIERTLEVCEHDLHEKGMRATIQTQATMHHVEGDALRLQQVLWNILKNSIKFTPPGGSIAVRTANRNGGRIQVEISDSGAGIDPQLLPNIFTAFEQGGRTVTSLHGGLGLGLAIAKTLVEVQSGRITASSQGKGHGTTFFVDLPTVPPPAHIIEHQATVASPPEQRSKCRILLVEDHKDTARVMARLLTQSGYEIRIAESVAAAGDLAMEDSFDLVISDLGLPDGSGIDLMRDLRSRYGTRGIALTGWGMEEDVRRTQEAGFEHHLTKPVDYQSLIAAIQGMVGGGSPVNG